MNVQSSNPKISADGITAYSVGKNVPLDNAEQLEAALRHIGATRYHSLHPFHALLHGGKLNKGQVQAWALNRYFYQSTIPIKDAVVISRFRDRATRLEWRHRIEDHDGDLGAEGGIERWLKLTEGLGLDSAYVESTEGILPATRYHSLHPFHALLHGGKLNKGQVQAWALNRYFYQSTIPIKDAVVSSRFRDRATRLEWRHRIEDHDGDLGAEGGIERWLKLTEGLGLDTAYVESTEGILPATRFAVEAYVHFVRDKTPLEAIASSLTELFAPNLHEERISGMLAHYNFVNPDIMSYFSRRLQQAPRDAGFALDYVKAHAQTPAEREAVCNALIFKTNVLWVQLDALYHAYVGGHIPPGAFLPKEN